MLLSDFDYELPADRIAQQPLPARSDSRMLQLDRHGGGLRDRQVRDFPRAISATDLIVLNDTRVLAARLFGHKETGGAVEVFLERILDSRLMSAKLRASKTPRPGTRLFIGPHALQVTHRHGELFTLESSCEIATLLDEQGHVPLPPYIQRPDAKGDVARYQTVWAREDGAVAAPTAGLHFDETLLQAVRATGATLGYVTLHVGSGTYQRVRQEDVDQHQLHQERVDVSASLCEQIEATRARGGRVIAVGTTVVRALETAALNAGDKQLIGAHSGETRLFIRPGFDFRVVDGLLTNFHEPQSTLLMLVCAFAGREAVLRAYAHARERKYRFLSYGDAMLIL